MKCPFCGAADTSVLESRTVDGKVRRRRECSKCEKRFTTFEEVKKTFLWVIKKDGRREPFDKEKIRRGILRAILKRPVSMDQVEGVLEDVEREMLKAEEAEVQSRAIGNAILKRLKKLDKVAWLRFASVYLEFEDLSDFEKAIEK
ncbi:MAG: Transcriptional repressor NrdR [Microgenomates group bacterium GW2011_GWC1_39_7b]|uniref:Transcriptional repressor NrdR n=2 Tax=Candidatus Woeseibacteriota TaxID=1752722 RepID=A0A0G0UU60_9BACT|nr:MAG: Transcriptional repressor NrdR [Candidatus Woesebacteria bacterium GW2011_GWB1_39_10]KKR26447.1 MAG: Transcriptional repressor NrdR [Microgenomates group bacterium GW2011_GWC1_39_7b]KKR92243.1 MAG: Transcriptional repressor NrdR [Candidatus Woesebacteria bacterium GW2011_GWA1_41_13b]